MKPAVLRLLWLVLLSTFAASAAFEAGTARVDITPREPAWMAGYAARKHPSTGVAQPLWAKALAIRDARGARVVIITMDLLRVPRSISDVVAEEVWTRHRVERSQLLMNCSHNHSGPALWENDAFSALSAADYEKTRLYTVWLTGELVKLVAAALNDLSPASLSISTGEAGFGANRRVAGTSGYQIGYNPNGPVDHRVPVIRVTTGNGALRAVLFGYACHNTTVGPSTYEINGDYAGFAQAALERAHPGVTALFLQLCAGDQDPHPRPGLDAAASNGSELASGVEKAISGRQQRLAGPLGTAFRTVKLAFAPHSREMFVGQLTDSNPAVVRNARRMIKAYDEGNPIVSLDYPVQAVQLGKYVTLVAIGGEPVVDYALRCLREFPSVILAGYSNSVKGYIPSRRVLAEGGYEGGDSMIYYGLPGPFTPAVEDAIFSTIREALRLADVSSKRPRPLAQVR